MTHVMSRMRGHQSWLADDSKCCLDGDSRCCGRVFMHWSRSCAGGDGLQRHDPLLFDLWHGDVLDLLRMRNKLNRHRDFLSELWHWDHDLFRGAVLGALLGHRLSRSQDFLVVMGHRDMRNLLREVTLVCTAQRSRFPPEAGGRARPRTAPEEEPAQLPRYVHVVWRHKDLLSQERTLLWYFLRNIRDCPVVLKHTDASTTVAVICGAAAPTICSTTGVWRRG